MEVKDIIELVHSLPTKLQDFKDIISETNRLLKSIDNQLGEKETDDFLDQFIPLETVLQKLNFSKRKWFYLRDQNELDFIQIGKHIYMTPKMIKDVMDKHTLTNENKKE